MLSNKKTEKFFLKDMRTEELFFFLKDRIVAEVSDLRSNQ